MPVDIHLTTKVKSKAPRLLSPRDVWQTADAAASGEADRIYERLDSNDPEYHVLTGPYSVVVKVDGDRTLVVVTQMHQHPDYHKDERYERVERIQEVNY